MTEFYFPDISIILELVNKFKEFSHTHINRRDITCLELIPLQKTNILVAQPRFHPSHFSITKEHKEIFEKIYGFILKIMHFPDLTSNYSYIYDLFNLNPEDPDYKRSFLCLIEEDVWETDEIYGDYYIEKNTNSLSDIFTIRRDRKNERVTENIDIDNEQEICNLIEKDAKKKIHAELDRRISMLEDWLKNCNVKYNSKLELDQSIEKSKRNSIVEDILNQMESHCLDFKAEFPKQGDDIGKLICAFCNHSGGDIYFGIRENKNGKEIIGIENEQDIELRISGIIKNFEVPPSITYEILYSDDNKKILCVHISKIKDPPILDYKGRFYYRNENSSSTRHLSAKEIQNILKNNLISKKEDESEKNLKLTTELTSLYEILEDFVKTDSNSIRNQIFRRICVMFNPIEFLPKYGIMVTGNGEFTCLDRYYIADYAIRDIGRRSELGEYPNIKEKILGELKKYWEDKFNVRIAK